MKKLWLILGVGIILSFYVVPRSFAAVTVKDNGWIEDKDENGDGRGDSGAIRDVCKGSSKTRVRSIMLDTGTTKFYLKYFACVDPKHLKEGQQCHGLWGLSSLGLYPGRWYLHSFIDVLVNDISLQHHLPEISSEKRAGEVVANYLWETPAAEINMEFKAKENHDYLALKVRIVPKKEIFSLKSRFLCFPGNIVPGKQERDRWVSTAERDVEHGNKITLNHNERWILYYDKIWDKAKRPNCSPCALFYPSLEPEKVVVDVYNYDIQTYFTYPNQREEFNYVIWADIPKTNEEALEYMRHYAEGEEDLKSKVDEWRGQISLLERKLEKDKKSIEAIQEKMEQAEKRGYFMPGEAKDIEEELLKKSLRYIGD